MCKRIPYDLSRFLNDDIYIINELFKSNGYEIYIVGGAIRDILLFNDSSNCDFDFTTNARPEEIIEIVKKRKISNLDFFTVPTGIKHGTVSIVFKHDNHYKNYEITTYRTEGKYLDNRRPEKVFFINSLIDDLSRRDFTINALAYDIDRKELIDAFNGLEDLNNKIIRCIGNPIERYNEDGLRPIRACRIASKLNFSIEENTFNSIGLVLDSVKAISEERFRDEFLKIMATNKPSIGIELLRKSGILEIFIPELLEGINVDQNEYHLYDVYTHNLKACDEVDVNRPLLRIAALFHDIAKPRAKEYALKNGAGNVFYNHEIIGAKMTSNILKRLKFSNNNIDYIVLMIKMHMFYYTEDWTDGAIRRFLRKINTDLQLLDDLFELRRADRIASGIKSGDADILIKFKERIDNILKIDNAFKIKDLKIDGNIIMKEFNLPQSKLIGEILNFLLEKVLDNQDLNTTEKLLELTQYFLDNYDKIKNSENFREKENTI